MSERVIHPIEPFFDSDSKILILGSFPSVKSREQRFFYGHPQNRFWRVLAALLNANVPGTIEEKKQLLSYGKIALWDVIACCDISGSSDSSIRNVVPNDMSLILDHAPINTIAVNGKTAERYYKKYILRDTGIEAICLPSTSPANAARSLDELIEIWGRELFEN